MKAFIETKQAAGGDWYAEVVTEDDYKMRGPHAQSHRTEMGNNAEDVWCSAVDWCALNGCEIVEVDEICA